MSTESSPQHPVVATVRSPCQRFQRREFIANGSAKAVYRARDEEEGIEVAWNEVDLASCSSQQLVEEEMERLATLDHPNILKCQKWWIDETSRRIVFITDLMVSGTLEDFFRERSQKKMKQHVLVKYCRQILSGLQYLHEKDIVHRGLTCNNIFVNGNKGEVKIGDVGLSSVKKTCVAFMAPEMLQNGVSSTAADVWSFGMCLLEMSTGKAPYSECEGVEEVTERLRNSVLPAFPIDDPAIKDVVQWCVQIHPKLRPTVQQLNAHYLFKVVDAAPLLSLSTTDSVSVMRWIQRAPDYIQKDVHQLAVNKKWISASMIGSPMHGDPTAAFVPHPKWYSPTTLKEPSALPRADLSVAAGSSTTSWVEPQAPGTPQANSSAAALAPEQPPSSAKPKERDSSERDEEGGDERRKKATEAEERLLSDFGKNFSKIQAPSSTSLASQQTE